MTDEQEQEEVAPSCGCVLCDLGQAAQWEAGMWMHRLLDKCYAIKWIECTRRIDDSTLA